jgi:hypothetical protein
MLDHDFERIDRLAGEGLKLSHYVVEPQCTPTRSALICATTARFSELSPSSTSLGSTRQKTGVALGTPGSPGARGN